MVEALQLGLDLFSGKAQAVVGMPLVYLNCHMCTQQTVNILGLSGNPQKKKELVAEQVDRVGQSV